jgi:hypothetical protein
MSMLNTFGQLCDRLYSIEGGIYSQARHYVTLHKQGRLKELEATLQGNEEALFAFIVWILFPEHLRDPEASACKWLLANSNLLLSAEGIIEKGFYFAIYCWHAEGIKTFLTLGADPNKEVMPQRFALDVCRNRAEYPPLSTNSLDFKPLEDAAEWLVEAGAQTYLEFQFRDKHLDPKVFALVDTRDSWVEYLLNAYGALPGPEQVGWLALLEHCTNKSKVPSKNWLKKLSNLIAAIDGDAFVKSIRQCIRLAEEKRQSLIFGDLKQIGDHYHWSDACHTGNDLWGMSKKNTILLKGMVWVISRYGDDCEYDLYCIAKAMYTKVPGIGIRNVKIANPCYAELLNIGSDKALLYALRLYNEADNQPAIKKMKALLDPYLKEKGISMNLLQLRLETENWDNN